MIPKDTELTAFGVAVIESLPSSECQTGTKLFYDILQPLQATDSTLFYELYSVSSVEEFKETIRVIIRKHKKHELIALHIEAHGCEEGAQLSSGELLSWKEFLDCCRNVNEEMCGLLVVTTAMCYSISLIAAVNPALRAPFKAIIITRRDVTVDEILRGYTEYFMVYRNCLDIGPAKEAMRKEVNSGTIETSPFEMITSEWLFDEITNPDRDPAAFQQITNIKFCELKAKDSSYTRERVDKEIRDFFHSLAENGKDYYTFADYWK